MSGIKWIAGCVVALTATVAQAATSLSCSSLETSGQVANLNELVVPGAAGNIKYIEVVTLGGSPVNTSGWQLCTKAGNGNKVSCTDFGDGDFYLNGDTAATDSGTTTIDSGTYFTLNTNLNGDEGEVVLLDASGNALDYIRYCKASCNSTPEWSVPSDCGATVDDVGTSPVIARYPEDSTGDWSSSNDPDGPSGPTEGDSNSGGGGDSSCTLGSFSVVQSARALACPDTRATVTVTAICADGTTVKDDYTGTVSLSASGAGQLYDAASGGATVASYTFLDAEDGVKTFYLDMSDTGSSSVSATDTTASITASGSATTFYAYGFLLSSPADMVCGNSQSLTLTAYGKSNNGSGQACEVLDNFNSNSVPVKAWYRINTDPDEVTSAATVDSVGSAITLAGSAISVHAEPGSSNLTLDFSAGGTATVSLAYANVGEVLDLNFRHDTAPYDGSLTDNAGNSIGPLVAVSTPFVVSPEQVVLSIADPSYSCASQDGSCTAFVAAGADFDLTLTAQCVGGATATQYDTGASSVALSSSLVAPAGGQAASLGVTSTAFDGSESGVKTVTQTVSEVGVFDLTAAPPSYFGSSVSADTLADVGRFYAHHFTLDAAQSRVDAACMSSTHFSYMAQPFDLLFTAQARNLAGVATLNYRDSFVKLDTVQGSISVGGVDTGTNLTARLSGTSPAYITDSTFSWLAGEGDILVPLLLNRDAAVDGPYSALELGVTVTDADSATMSSAALDLDVGNGSNEYAKVGETEVRYGRLVVLNSYGPETSPLSQPLLAQYYDGTQFIQNADDGCTSLVAGDFALVFADDDSSDDSYTLTPGVLTGISVDSGSTDATLAYTPFDSGSAGYSFGSGANGVPGAGNTGSVITIVTAPAWLQYDWDSAAAGDENPSGTATFGRYRGNDRVIYWLEQ